MPPNITYTCSNRELRTSYSNQSYLWAPLIPRTFFLPLDTIVCLPWTFITEPSYLLFWCLNTVIISAPKSFLLKTKYPWFLMVWHNTRLCQKGQIPVIILHGSFSHITVVFFDYFCLPMMSMKTLYSKWDMTRTKESSKQFYLWAPLIPSFNPI